MRILQVVPYAELGGTEKAVGTLSRGLVQRGHEVLVLTPTGPGHIYFDGLKWERLPDSPWQRRARIRRMAPFFDLVHIHAARELVLSCSRPVVFTPHSYYNALDRFAVRLCAQSATVICFTEWEKGMLQRLGLGKLAVIPNGLEEVPLLRKPQTNTPPRIGYLGRLTKDKGLDLLFRELVKVQAPYELWIAGRGKEEKKLKALAAALNLPVTFLGFQEPFSFLNSLDIFVLPSRTETFGLALIEAMSQGLCCVAADVCGLGEILGDAGITAPHSRLGEALEEALQKSDLRETLGERARQRFLRYYTEERMIRETEGLYLTLV